MISRENNFAYIDGQNLYLAIQELGWKLDYKKFRIYLMEKYGIKKAYMFMGFLPANLVKHLDISGKLLKVLSPSVENCSSLLKKVAGNKISFVSDLRRKLEYIKKEPHKDRTS